MNTKRGLTKWLHVTLLAAITIFTTAGFTVVDHSNDAARITSDYAVCALIPAEVAEFMPPDVVDRVCATESVAVPSREENSAALATSSDSFDPSSWEYTLELENLAMEEMGLSTPAKVSSPSFSPSSWEYTLELENLAMEEMGLVPSANVSSRSSSSPSWEYARAMEDHAMNEGR